MDMTIQQQAVNTVQTLTDAQLEALLPLLDMLQSMDSDVQRSQMKADAVDNKAQRQPGKYRDQIWMAEDFDAPLEEFQEYM